MPSRRDSGSRDIMETVPKPKLPKVAEGLRRRYKMKGEKATTKTFKRAQMRPMKTKQQRDWDDSAREWRKALPYD